MKTKNKARGTGRGAWGGMVAMLGLVLVLRGVQAFGQDAVPPLASNSWDGLKSWLIGIGSLVAMMIVGRFIQALRSGAGIKDAFMAVWLGTNGPVKALVLFLGLAGLAVGCVALKPGADPLVVRVEQTQTVAKSAFDNVLQIDNGNREFYRTNAPAFHAFCEWLRQPQPVPGLATPLPRDYALLWNLDQVKLAYVQAKTISNSNAVVEILATVSSAASQANDWIGKK